MRNLDDILGFKVHYIGAEDLYEIKEFPNFPDDTPQAKYVFDGLEFRNFNYKNIKLPAKVNITQRVKTFKYEDILCFTFRDLFDIIKLDENQFMNTQTFIKTHLEYKNKMCILTIKYYTIDENGTHIIRNKKDLLKVAKIRFNKKIYTSKFKTNKKLKKSYCHNYLEYIPIIPLLWLDYDENNQLPFLDYFKIIEDNMNLPF